MNTARMTPGGADGRMWRVWLLGRVVIATDCYDRARYALAMAVKLEDGR